MTRYTIEFADGTKTWIQATSYRAAHTAYTEQVGPLEACRIKSMRISSNQINVMGGGDTVSEAMMLHVEAL